MTGTRKGGGSLVYEMTALRTTRLSSGLDVYEVLQAFE